MIAWEAGIGGKTVVDKLKAFLEESKAQRG